MNVDSFCMGPDMLGAFYRALAGISNIRLRLSHVSLPTSARKVVKITARTFGQTGFR